MYFETSQNLNSKSIGWFWSHLISYPTPADLSYAWSLGSLGGMVLATQIGTGFFLASYYSPEVSLAFDSLEYIIREVNNGWFMRSIHANGASMFFILMYLHSCRNYYIRSYRPAPRYVVWFLGILLFIAGMLVAFTGYILPWGQMSFWGATVITNLFSAIPFIGLVLSLWLWGGFAIDNATLGRFFSLHYIVPLLLFGLVLMHLLLLHEAGSNSASGGRGADFVLFYPYYALKDALGYLTFLLAYIALVFFYPNTLGDADNSIPASSIVTPPHIVPEWYFLPFYAVLRTVPQKLLGVLAMAAAIVIWFVVPALDPNIGGSTLVAIQRFLMFVVFVVFALLGWVGMMPPTESYVGGGSDLVYAYFLVLILIPIVVWVLDHRMTEWEGLVYACFIAGDLDEEGLELLLSRAAPVLPYNGWVVEYGYWLTFFCTVLCLAFLLFALALLLSSNRPIKHKNAPYECGFMPFSDARANFDVHFYLVALMFVLLDVELVLIFPWALCASSLGLWGYWTMFLFLTILGVGFAYEWASGALVWSSVTKINAKSVHQRPPSKIAVVVGDKLGVMLSLMPAAPSWAGDYFYLFPNILLATFTVGFAVVGVFIWLKPNKENCGVWFQAYTILVVFTYMLTLSIAGWPVLIKFWSESSETAVHQQLSIIFFDGMLTFDYSCVLLGQLLGLSVLVGAYLIKPLADSLDKTDTLRSMRLWISLMCLLTFGSILILSSQLLLTFLLVIGLSMCAIGLMGQNLGALSTEATVKYYVIGVLSNLIMGVGVFLILAHMASWGDSLHPDAASFAALNSLVHAMSVNAEPGYMVTVGSILVLIGFFTKLGLFPFQLWVPDVYFASHTSIVYILSVPLRLAFLFGLLRPMLWIFCYVPQARNFVVLACVGSLIIGSLGAIRTKNVKVFIAYSSMFHSALMVLPLAVGMFDPASNIHVHCQVAVFQYALVYALATALLFCTLLDLNPPTIYPPIITFSQLAWLRLTTKYNIGALGATIAVLILAGLPPTSGFIIKYSVLYIAFNSEYSLAVIPILIFGLVSLAYYLRFLKNIWSPNNPDALVEEFTARKYEIKERLSREEHLNSSSDLKIEEKAPTNKTYYPSLGTQLFWALVTLTLLHLIFIGLIHSSAMALWGSGFFPPWSK